MMPSQLDLTQAIFEGVQGFSEYSEAEQLILMNYYTQHVNLISDFSFFMKKNGHHYVKYPGHYSRSKGSSDLIFCRKAGKAPMVASTYDDSDSVIRARKTAQYAHIAPVRKYRAGDFFTSALSISSRWETDNDANYQTLIKPF